ncbi:beta-ketoacyl-[acyl-carrier-protein] synthase II [Dictyobacter alpinus]|uniref:Beta-ketoacyl-[acyl-carrier-protein] synthase II n=2 Tax=Dictyobacter alpinus TaxID=2014873 RepID=A0A402BB48_9CHLR|nr:beta-ketoacyl-[acyl-carrier-protein] synthase II [Dictyobacter alpinus]
MGVLSPYGVGTDLLWENLVAGESGITPLTAFDASALDCQVGGQLNDFRATNYLSPRVARKIDPFSTYALVTTQIALKQAGLLLENGKPRWSQQEQDSHRVGVCVGNNLGGWQFAERELYHLWQQGPREVSPYMATAWFPAAVQGNMSIQFGLRGIGRTFLSDRASAAMAIIHAADCLRRGKSDIMIAGGSEAPFSYYAALCYETSGLMSKRTESQKLSAYRPFDAEHNGLVAADGAAFFIMERVEDAIARGAPILAEISSWATNADGYDAVQPAPDGQRYAAAMTQALKKSDMSVEEIDCIFAAGSAVPTEDISETRAVNLAFAETARRVPVATPKSAFGNAFGAATALDMAIAIQAMEHQTIPGAINLEHVAPECELNHVTTTQPVENLHACLINARGMGGTNASLVLKDWSQAHK